MDNFLRMLRYASLAIGVSFSAVVAAGGFDGSVPLVCIAEQAHDCLPTGSGCKRLEPQTDIAPIFRVDYAKQEVRSPYRTAMLRILRTSVNADSLVMQGGDLLVAWSALID